MTLADRQSEAKAPEPGAGDLLRGQLPLSLQLRHGSEAQVFVRYELIGNGPLLIVAGGISADRHVLPRSGVPEPGWWQSQSGSFDLSRWSILGVDWLGADGELDLPIDPLDQANAVRAVLDHLAIERAAAFIGASYGGMVALQLAAHAPSHCGAILVISASAAAHPFASACRSLQRRALALGEASGDPAAGIRLARAIAMLTYRTPTEFEERFTDLPRIDDGHVRIGADSYLDHHGRKHVTRMGVTAYRRLSESIDLHRIDPADIHLPATLAGVDSDSLVPIRDSEALAAAIPGARFRRIESRFGHDAFLKEDAQVAAIITEFLQSLESQS